MKETAKKKKSIYLFSIIMGAICVLLLGVSMLTNEMLILKVLFLITLVSDIGLLLCFFRDRKRGYKQKFEKVEYSTPLTSVERRFME